jgi:nucleoside-diphosphate-sugar epimerase
MKVAITGANGEIGGIIAPALAREHDVRLAVWELPGTRQPAEFSEPGLDLHRLDIRDASKVSAFVRGADAVVHLAGEREVTASWARLRGPNIDGTFNVFDACREHSVGKIVFASSSHVTGGYNLADQEGLSGSETVRPDSLYGVTKVFGEALGRYLSDFHDISVICLRIGWVLPVPHGDWAMRMWLSPRDLCGLVSSALSAQVRYGVYYGISNNAARLWDLGPAIKDLGYLPVDDSARSAREPGLDPPAPADLPRP